MIKYDEFMEQLLEGYASSFDIERLEDKGDGLVAKAAMHVVESQCAVFKELEMWSAKADEYVYFYHIPHLTEEEATRIIDEVYKDGMPLIDLEHVSFKKQHMCTHLVALIICDTADEAAIKKIQKCRIYKSFQFSLKGWMEMHTDLLVQGSESVFSNRYGKETAKYLKMHVEHYNKTHV